ncbi:unnamed protein product [Ectocarpus sp. CCAP 1310/34]|nr:unnamed protein product [Ectocarpus sp. CCAP 1310/34]
MFVSAPGNGTREEGRSCRVYAVVLLESVYTAGANGVPACLLVDDLAASLGFVSTSVMGIATVCVV